VPVRDQNSTGKLVLEEDGKRRLSQRRVVKDSDKEKSAMSIPAKTGKHAQVKRKYRGPPVERALRELRKKARKRQN